MKKFILLLPWWFGVLREALKADWASPMIHARENISAPVRLAALEVMGDIWMRYIGFIPPDRQENFKNHLINSLEDSIASMPAPCEILAGQKYSVSRGTPSKN